MKRSILIMSLLASVAACSSGGGGDPSGAASVAGDPPSGDPPSTAAAFQFPATAGSVSSQAAVVGSSYGTACYTADAQVCAAGIGPTANTAQGGGSGSGQSTVTLTTDGTGENLLQLNIVDGGSGIKHTYDLGNAGDNAHASGNANGIFYIPDGAPDGEGNTFALSYGGSAAGVDPALSYVTFGLWNAGNGTTSNGAMGAFNAGNITTDADMSALVSGNKSADYSGQMVGQAFLNGSTYSVSGAPSMHINFGGATPGFTGSVATSIDTGAWTTFSYNGSLSGAQLSGTISAPAATIANGTGAMENVSAMSGAINGACYGPSCANIGTIFNMAGGTNNTVIGAMGLHTP